MWKRPRASRMNGYRLFLRIAAAMLVFPFCHLGATGCSNAKAREALGFQPRCGLADGPLGDALAKARRELTNARFDQTSPEA